MKFFALASLFAVTLASPVLEARAAPDLSKQVQGNITQAGKDLVTLNNTLNTVGDNDKTISFFTLVAIMNQSNKITYDIGNATAATQKSKAFTSAESTSLGKQIINLKPSIFSVLDNFGRHEPAFRNQGVQGQVVDGLKTQQGKTKALGAAFQPKFTGPYKAGVASNTTQIVNYFQKIINEYAS